MEYGQTKNLIPNIVPSFGTADLGMGRVVIPWRALGGDEIHTMGHHLPQDHWFGLLEFNVSLSQ